MTSAEYKAARERLGTQAEVASLLGINRVTVAKREGGALVTREAELAILALRKPKRSRKQGNDLLTREVGGGKTLPKE